MIILCIEAFKLHAALLFFFECAYCRQNLKMILEESKSVENEKEMEVVV